MPFIQINLDEVPDQELLDPGWYRVRVEGAEVRKNRNNDGQHISWRLRVVEGQYENRVLFLNTGLSGGGERILKRFLKAAGFDWSPEGFATEDVLGSELEVRVEHRQAEDGSLRNDIRGFRSL